MFNPYVGIELERNLCLKNGHFPQDMNGPVLFWESFKEDPSTLEVKYDVSSQKPTGVFLKDARGQTQMLVNDTGYYELEFASPVYTDLTQAEQDWTFITEKIDEHSEAVGTEPLTLLGIGVHPFLEANSSNYYHYRTPKGHLYSLLCEGSEYTPGRNWEHFQYLNATSDQINIDLPPGKEHESMLTLNRLMGLFVSISANAPFENGKLGHSKSMRQYKQAAMFSTSRYSKDRELTGMPAEEPQSYEWYLKKIFMERPVVFCGSGKMGELYLPLKEDKTAPTLYEYFKKSSWEAYTVEGKQQTLVPQAEDLQSPLHRLSFWHVKPQFNFSKADPISIAEFLEALEESRLEALFDEKKVIRYAEIRAIDAAQPGEELAMPAFVKGLMIAHDEAYAFSQSLPYEDWKAILQLGGTHGMDWEHKGKSAQDYLKTLLEIARNGLRQVNEGRELRFLEPIERDIALNQCPADRLIAAYTQNSWDAVLPLISY